MMKPLRLKALGKEGMGGLLVVVIGVGVVVKASGYPLGTVSRMGPGFMPVVYGVLIALVGLALIATAAGSQTARRSVVPPDIRAAACVLGGLVTFVVVGGSLGLAPATFLSVFIAALGDRANSVRDAALLAGTLLIVAVVVFSYGLGLELPLFRWF